MPLDSDNAGLAEAAGLAIEAVCNDPARPIRSRTRLSFVDRLARIERILVREISSVDARLQAASDLETIRTELGIGPSYIAKTFKCPQCGGSAFGSSYNGHVSYCHADARGDNDGRSECSFKWDAADDDKYMHVADEK